MLLPRRAGLEKLERVVFEKCIFLSLLTQSPPISTGSASLRAGTIARCGSTPPPLASCSLRASVSPRRKFVLSFVFCPTRFASNSRSTPARGPLESSRLIPCFVWRYFFLIVLRAAAPPRADVCAFFTATLSANWAKTALLSLRACVGQREDALGIARYLCSVFGRTRRTPCVSFAVR